MDEKVHIFSKETIKPSSPTPEHLRTYNLSLLDQLSVHSYIPIILFYDSITSQDSTKASDHLKKSLAETLTHFYPLAGRSKNGTFIDCNDDGATFVEAHVTADVHKIVKQPDIEQLQHLLPCNPHENLAKKLRNEEILAVQVNHFTSGGMAISVCFNHVAGDASTAATFIEGWAALARGSDQIHGLIFDCTPLFPPMETMEVPKSSFVDESLLLKYLTKRFVFKGSKIAALREKIGNGPYLDRPTRFEAVSAIIWGAVMAETKERSGQMKEIMASTIVDLRKRMNPPLSPQYFGNICLPATASSSLENAIDYNELAGKIHESVRQMNDENVRKGLFRDMLKFLSNADEEFGKKPPVGVFTFSSFCRFPFYEADFGWGKPIWVGSAQRLGMSAVFLDTSDGEGIEVWLGLPKVVMKNIEQNPYIFGYALFSSSD